MRPDPQSRRLRPLLTRLASIHKSVLLLVLASIGIAFALGLPHPTSAQPVDSGWQVVADRAGILDEGQYSSAVGDANRLNQYGIPIQIVTERTGYTQDQATARANELRQTNGVESGPGKDDGLLIYASVSPTDPSDVVVAISAGNHALPVDGFSVGDLDTIRETIVTPQLADGHPARAIVYALREMMYQAQFTPPAGIPLAESWQERRNTFQVVSVAVVLAAGTLAIAIARTRYWAISLIVAGAISLGMFALSVAFRSGLGITCSLVLVALVIGLAVWRDGAALNNVLGRRIEATPRPPGRFRPIAR